MWLVRKGCRWLDPSLAPIRSDGTANGLSIMLNDGMTFDHVPTKSEVVKAWRARAHT